MKAIQVSTAGKIKIKLNVDKTAKPGAEKSFLITKFWFTHLKKALNDKKN